jgi:hypothetical protein
MDPSSPVISWLLEAASPSIRYLTLTRLLELPLDDPRVNQTREEIALKGPVPAILARQSPAGNWQGEHSYYTPKYVSTHWSMMLLAEFTPPEVAAGAAMRRGAEFMLADTREWITGLHGAQAWDIQCLWGNILRYAAQSGLQDDERTRAAIAYLAESALEGNWRCPHNDGQPCAWGAARSLWGFAALRERAQIPGVEETIAYALHFLLEEYPLVSASYPTPRGKISPFWAELNFPLFYQADILFVLRVLGELGLLAHPGAAAALDWLAAKQEENGRFPGQSPFSSRTYGLGGASETRRWVTLQALGVLKQAGR